MAITEHKRVLAKRYDLPVCDFQYSIGEEVPCCVWKHAWVLNGAKSAASGLAETKRKTGVTTACVPYTMADGCRDGIDESTLSQWDQNPQTPTLNSTTSPSIIT